MELREFCRGGNGSVAFLVLNDGSCPVSDFFEGDGAKEAAKMAALFKRYADHGYITNREKFKKLESDLFEFKGHQSRLLCFPIARSMVITHGVIKKQNDLDPTDVAKARRLRDDYLASLPRKK